MDSRRIRQALGPNITERDIQDHVAVISATLGAEYIGSKAKEEEDVIAAIERQNLIQGAPAAFPSGSPGEGSQPRGRGQGRGRGRRARGARGARGRAQGNNRLGLAEEPPIPIAAPEAPAVAAAQPDANEVAATLEGPPPLPVTKHTLDLFHMMFSAADTAGKDVPWQKFVQAMVDAGFTATHCGGSAVAFEDTGRTRSKIVFHKPHPVAKINPVMLRAYGKRLQRHFDWSLERFVLR